MNERILELAEQAGFDVKRLTEPYPSGFPRGDILALEIFAELIVRECLEISQVGSITESKLKKHFGVE